MRQSSHAIRAARRTRSLRWQNPAQHGREFGPVLDPAQIVERSQRVVGKARRGAAIFINLETVRVVFPGSAAETRVVVHVIFPGHRNEIARQTQVKRV